MKRNGKREPLICTDEEELMGEAKAEEIGRGANWDLPPTLLLLCIRH